MFEACRKSKTEESIFMNTIVHTEYEGQYILVLWVSEARKQTCILTDNYTLCCCMADYEENRKKCNLKGVNLL